MPDREDGKMQMTDFGWALRSKDPTRKDLFWIPEGTDEIYQWDGDGWFRVRPPEMVRYPDGDLKHG